MPVNSKLKKPLGRQHCDEAAATDETGEFKTEPGLNTQPQLNIVMDVTTNCQSNLKLKKHRGRQHCDEANVSRHTNTNLLKIAN